MVACCQKYCRFCVKPYFKDGKFVFGQCKKSRNLILFSDAEDTKEYKFAQPLYCKDYEKRVRPIKY